MKMMKIWSAARCDFLPRPGFADLRLRPEGDRLSPDKKAVEAKAMAKRT
jgi:hypothetical protein